MGTRIDDATKKVTLVATDKLPIGDGSFLPKYIEVSQVAEYAVSAASAAITSINNQVSILGAARTSIGQAVSVNTASIAAINSTIAASTITTAQASSLIESYGYASVNYVSSTYLTKASSSAFSKPDEVSTMISAANIYTVAQTSGRDLALTDLNTYIYSMGTSAISMRVPTCASVAFPIGTQLMFRMRGTGKLSVSAGVGVSVQVPSSCSAEGRGQGSTFSLIKVLSDTWDITGDLSVL